MLKPSRILLMLCLQTLLCTGLWAASFDTQQLERLAGYLKLQQLDTLPVGITNTYAYRNHPLTIRKNQWGEIEHIGLLLFSQGVRHNQPLPVYDFLERYLLSRMVTPVSSDDAVRMQWDKVHFGVGTPQTALRIDTLTGFGVDYADLHVYRVTWQSGEQKLLEVSFTMDYQLMAGADLVELEQRFMRQLRRNETRQPSVVVRRLPERGTEYTLSDTYYMSPMVRNDLYFTRRSEQHDWQLVNDTARATRTICNWMVAPDSDKELPLELSIMKYGYEVETLDTNYRAWQQQCIDEGCSPYYGLKCKKDGQYQCSVFMVNRTGGYTHLLSINIPEAALTQNEGVTATAKFYAYIPLHNMSSQLLHNTEYEPVK